MDMRIALLFGLLALGCNNVEGNQFGGGAGNGGSGDITTGGLTTDEGSPPEIVNISAGVDNWTTLGWVIVTIVTFSDPDDDLQGGRVYLTVTDYTGEIDEFELTINGQDAVIDGEELTFAISDIEYTERYDLVVQLEDAAGNTSEEWEAVVNG